MLNPLRFNFCFSALFLALSLLSLDAMASRLTIEVTRGVDNPTRIAVVPFRRDHATGIDLASVVSADLSRSGRFEVIDRSLMLSSPAVFDDVYFRDWRALGVEYLVIGVSSIVEGKREIDFELVDINQRRTLHKQMFKGSESIERKLAHRVSDAVYQKLTGVPGAFSTRLLYVSVARDAGSKRPNRLYLADSDGANFKVMLESEHPILSPTWSPDGKQVAYVSFENDRPAIYRQNLATAVRERLTNYPGLNSSPAWSPDGRYMAMVLSKDGNPDIYVMDLRTRDLERLTDHFAIDTEPAWMPDGKSLVFTSDRGGAPQIYKLDIKSKKVQRLTFEGSYNAAADVLPDGKSLVMVHHGAKPGYQIVWYELGSGRMIELTQSNLDESPSIAPNGSMLLYATKDGDRGELAAVALDGKFKYRLPSPNSDVREPAWSPN